MNVQPPPEPTQKELNYAQDKVMPILEGMVKQAAGVNTQLLDIREKWESINLATANTKITECVYWLRQAISEIEKEAESD